MLLSMEKWPGFILNIFIISFTWVIIMLTSLVKSIASMPIRSRTSIILIMWLFWSVCLYSCSALEVALSQEPTVSELGSSAGMSTTSGSLLRWTNRIVRTSYTTSQVTDAFVPTYFSLAFRKGEVYNMEGETSNGTPFVLRFRVEKATASYNVKPHYAAPILSNRQDKIKHMAWGTGSSNTIKFCPESPPWSYGNNEFQWWDSYRKDRETDQCICGTDDECSSPAYATDAACLGKDGSIWWARPLFDGSARWGNFRVNFVDHYSMQGSCNLGGCTPPGVIYSFLQPWSDTGEVNTVFIVELDKDSVEYEYAILVEPLLGLPSMTPCTITKDNPECVFDTDGTRVAMNDFQAPVYDTKMAIFLKCTEDYCTHIKTARWLLPGTINDEFPAIKWKQFPGPNCAQKVGRDLSAVTFWPDVVYQRFTDSDSYFAENNQVQGLYHTSDKGSNDPCGDRYTSVDQSISAFDQHTDDLLYCDSVDVGITGYTEFPNSYSAFYKGPRCTYTNTGCFYSGVNVSMDSCQGGQMELYAIVTSDEIVITPPDGVPINTCILSVSGYYNADEGAVLTIRNCASFGPVKLQIRDSEIFFAGGLTTIYQTFSESTATTIVLTVTYAATTMTVYEVYSDTSSSVTLNLLDAQVEFPPDITDGGSDTLGDGFNFFRTTFGKFFAMLLIISAIIFVFVIASCICKSNEAKTTVVDVSSKNK